MGTEKKTVTLIFVLPEDCKDVNDTTDIMQLAYEASKQHMAKTEWFNENECINKDFDKTDCVIFQEFKGKAFEALEKKKCVIVGPWVLIVCLNEGLTIPNLPWPIFNVAMKDCIVSSSHLPKKNKLEIKEKVQRMGGIYVDALSQSATHLVTNSVNSEKYIKAAEVGLSIMLTSWIDAVWEASLKRNVHCNDKEFQQYRCLALNNLTISSTGITDASVKKKLQKLVVENGGIFTATMNLHRTDVLVCEGTGATLSEKYKAARSSKYIKCVSLQWIEDSIEKGYALPYENYLVKKCTSTPNKENALNPDFSVLSAINNSQFPQNKTSLQETISSGTPCSFKNVTGLKRKSSSLESYGELLNSIDLRIIKNAGPFLDGCSIYLAGFTTEQKERLSKIINFSGATRYDDISDRISHVVVGDNNSHDLKAINSRQHHSAVVTLNWFVDSINRRTLLPEEDYLVNNVSVASKEFSSPQSKKGFNLLRAKNTVTEGDVRKQKSEVKTVLDFGQDDNILNKYLNAGATEPDTFSQFLNDNCTFGNGPTEKIATATSQNITERNSDNTNTNANKSSSVSSMSVTCSENNAPLNIYNGLTFHLVELDEDKHYELKSIIKDIGGKISSQGSETNYSVMPMFNYKKYSVTGSLVTELWIKECLEKEKICDIHYYHQPLFLLDTKPLKGCVITISGYADNERFFLGNLIRELGAICQEQLAKKASIQKNLAQNTHLLSTNNNSLKYTSALKWGLPIVDKDWLLECARTGEFVPEKRSNNTQGTTKTVESVTTNLITPSKTKERSETSQSSKHILTPVNTEQNSNLKENHSSLSRNTITDKDLPASTPSMTPVSFCAPVSSKRALPTPVNTEQNSSFQGNHSSSSLNTVTNEDLSTLTSSKTPNVSCATPKNENVLDNVLSQVTPVHKIMEEVRKQIPWDTPDGSPASKYYGRVETPKTPLGAFLGGNPSPNERKEWVRYLNNFPEWKPFPERRLSTPMSELKRRLWDKVCPPKPEGQPNFDEDLPSQTSECHSQETPEKQLIDKKLQQLDTMLKASGGSNRRSSMKCTIPVQANRDKDSQPCSVGWDYLECESTGNTVFEDKGKLFMLSGLSSEERETVKNLLKSLGAKVSELDSYDPLATHLICHKPTRNEKTLSFMAAGKWILHVSYVSESVKAERLLDEEDFEFGNPKANKHVILDRDNSFASKVSYIHWWRQEVAKRGYGAFHDMRAILVAANKGPLINVIEAGGGMVVEAEPPFDDDVYATHCLLETKTIQDLSLYIPLAKKGIFCVSTAYISDFLCGSVKDTRENVMPFFKKYYL